MTFNRELSKLGQYVAFSTTPTSADVVVSFGTTSSPTSLFVEKELLDHLGYAGTTGDVLTSTGAGVSWSSNIGGGGGGGVSVTISDTAPISPTDGNLWWKSSTGRLNIYYQDIDSSQWVEASPPLAPTADPITQWYFEGFSAAPSSAYLTGSGAGYLGGGTDGSSYAGKWWELTTANAGVGTAPSPVTTFLAPPSTDYEPTLTGLTFDPTTARFSGFAPGRYEFHMEYEAKHGTGNDNIMATQGFETSTSAYSNSSYYVVNGATGNSIAWTVHQTFVTAFANTTPANNWIRYYLNENVTAAYWPSQALLTIRKIG